MTPEQKKQALEELAREVRLGNLGEEDEPYITAELKRIGATEEDLHLLV